MLLLPIALLMTAQANPKPPVVLRPLTSAETQVIQSAVQEELSDPESAQFKMLPLSKNSGAYCAYVNSKNRFGGYVGVSAFKVFITKNMAGKVVEASYPSVEDRRAGIIADLLRVVCRSEGYEMPILGPGR